MRHRSRKAQFMWTCTAALGCSPVAVGQVASFQGLGGLPDSNYVIPFGVTRMVNGNPVRAVAYVPTDGDPVDWDDDGVMMETGSVQDINFLGPNSGIPGLDMPSPGQILNGFNDWANLQYTIGTTGNSADNIHIDLPDGEIQ